MVLTDNDRLFIDECDEERIRVMIDGENDDDRLPTDEKL
jgi:hypothetical protein